MQWPLWLLPWRTPARDAAAGWSAFVPGLARKYIALWDEVVQQEHPLHDEFDSCWYLEYGTSSTVVPYTRYILQ